MNDVTVIDANDKRGASWEVGATADQGLALTLGPAKVVLYGELRDRYAEAVARAVTPGQASDGEAFRVHDRTIAGEIVVIADDYGDELIVVAATGSVGLSAAEPGVLLNGAKLDQLRELLDRAAMPGVT